jgi:uncharacterized protein involved in exopolysaccharide biosynthesis
VSTADLLVKIIKRLKKFRLLILLFGIGFAGLLYWYAKKTKTIYTSRASVFPLTSSSDNSAVNGTLSSILGISEAPKSFSNEASINIIELATSRSTREAVALERLDSFKNKTIAEMLIRTSADKSIDDPNFVIPKDTAVLKNMGGTILKAGLQAKINKNGILEINFSCTNEKLVAPISYKIVEKISDFYRELRVEKAQRDYNFTVQKVDSLDKVLDKIDQEAIRMYKTTQFTPSDRLEYSLPKENLSALKERMMRQRDVAANNREEAMWRLQKQTPIISILDKPDPPFDKKESSPIMFAIIGFIVGCILSVIIFSGSLILKYAENELQKAIFKGPAPATAEINPNAAIEQAMPAK